MPRIKRTLEAPRRPRFPDLLSRLLDELKNQHDSGQPTIEEFLFPKTNALRVTVIWDEWDSISDEDRAAIIRQAYEAAEGKEISDRIALAIGLTVREAKDFGLLPFQIVPALRKGDPVSRDECTEAMVAEGASSMFDDERPQLRFSTEDDAKACVERLVKRLPKSEQVWTIMKDVGTEGRDE